MAIPAVLLQSQVWNSIGIYEPRFLSFLLVEHLRHSRTMNGYLTATFDQLETQRIPRSFIARTINNLVELGLLKVTHQGGHAGGARQNPSRYRLTFLNSSLRSVATEYLPATNDWVEVELALLDGQVIQEVYQDVAELTVFQRTPNLACQCGSGSSTMRPTGG